MIQNRQSVFTRQAPTQRAGVFGANRARQQDRNAFGAQRAINATQGRVQGGKRPSVFGATKARQQGNRQRQLFAQRVAPRAGRSRIPMPRVPLQRGGRRI